MVPARDGQTVLVPGQTPGQTTVLAAGWVTTPHSCLPQLSLALSPGTTMPGTAA